MEYRDLEKLVLRQAEAASEESRASFARKSIELLQFRARGVIGEELTEQEQQLLADLLEGLDSRPPSDSKALLEIFDHAISQDEIRAIEFDHRLTFLIVSIDHYLLYQLTHEHDFIERICITMIDSVDFEITMLGEGAPEGYGSENMFGDRRMVAEFERQRSLLAGLPAIDPHQ